MRLVSFLMKEREYVNEDAYSIVIDRPYKARDIFRLESIFRDCEALRIDLQVDIRIVRKGINASFLRNFRVVSTGMRCLLESVSPSIRSIVRTRLAATKSIGPDSQAVARQLQSVFELVGNRFFRVYLFLRKSELSAALNRKSPIASEHQIWLKTKNFQRFVKEEPKEFLKLVWGSKEPVVVLLGYSRRIRCGFCLISGVPVSKTKLETEKREAVRELVREIIRDSAAVPFALALTLSPASRYSRKLLARLFGMLPSVSKLLLAESQFYDFKSSPSDVAKPAAAFANACGGLVIFGVSPAGIVSGCNMARDPDRIADSLKGIEPTIDCHLMEAHPGNKSMLALLIGQAPGRTVHHLQNGVRPFRFKSVTKLYAYDEEVLRARREICRT